MCILFPDKPPQSVKSRGARGAQQQAMLDKQNNPNVFALGLKDAACKEPVCCCISSLGTPCGLTACWARKAVLEKYGKGVDDYVCCQGYVPKMCCVEPATMCKGSPVGLFLEGCCCPVLSLSIARLHIMDKKQIRPDGCDWQIIGCSNCLQCFSCILDMVAMVVSEARELAELIGCIADLFTCAVGGCMGAQVHHEIKGDAAKVQHRTAPAVGAPESQEIER